VHMIAIAYIISNFMAQLIAPYQVKIAGMRTMLLLMTVLQALLTLLLIFTRRVDMAICISAFMGLTGGRQTFAYLYLTDIVPMTHISFVSMWFSSSSALAILAQCAYFFFFPHWKYLLLFNAVFGLFVAVAGSCILVESPMFHLLKGDSSKAARSLEHIKRLNNLVSRQLPLYELHKRIRLS